MSQSGAGASPTLHSAGLACDFTLLPYHRYTGEGDERLATKLAMPSTGATVNNNDENDVGISASQMSLQSDVMTCSQVSRPDYGDEGDFMSSQMSSQEEELLSFSQIARSEIPSLNDLQEKCSRIQREANSYNCVDKDNLSCSDGRSDITFTQILDDINKKRFASGGNCKKNLNKEINNTFQFSSSESSASSFWSKKSACHKVQNFDESPFCTANNANNSFGFKSVGSSIPKDHTNMTNDSIGIFKPKPVPVRAFITSSMSGTFGSSASIHSNVNIPKNNFIQSAGNTEILSASTKFVSPFQRAGQPGNPFQKFTSSGKEFTLRTSYDMSDAISPDKTELLPPSLGSAVDKNLPLKSNNVAAPSVTVRNKPVFERPTVKKATSLFAPVFKKPVKTAISSSTPVAVTTKPAEKVDTKPSVISSISAVVGDKNTNKKNTVCQKSCHIVKQTHAKRNNLATVATQAAPSKEQSILNKPEKSFLKPAAPPSFATSTTKNFISVTNSKAATGSNEPQESSAENVAAKCTALRLKKTTVVPKPKIAIKTEEELCGTESTESTCKDYLQNKIPVRKPQIAKKVKGNKGNATKEMENMQDTTKPKLNNNRQRREINLQNFKRKFSHLYRVEIRENVSAPGQRAESPMKKCNRNFIKDYSHSDCENTTTDIQKNQNVNKTLNKAPNTFLDASRNEPGAVDLEVELSSSANTTIATAKVKNNDYIDSSASKSRESKGKIYLASTWAEEVSDGQEYEISSSIMATAGSSCLPAEECATPVQAGVLLTSFQPTKPKQHLQSSPSHYFTPSATSSPVSVQVAAAASRSLDSSNTSLRSNSSSPPPSLPSCVASVSSRFGTPVDLSFESNGGGDKKEAVDTGVVPPISLVMNEASPCGSNVAASITNSAGSYQNKDSLQHEENNDNKQLSESNITEQCLSIPAKNPSVKIMSTAVKIKKHGINALCSNDSGGDDGNKDGVSVNKTVGQSLKEKMDVIYKAVMKRAIGNVEDSLKNKNSATNKTSSIKKGFRTGTLSKPRFEKVKKSKKIKDVQVKGISKHSDGSKRISDIPWAVKADHTAEQHKRHLLELQQLTPSTVWAQCDDCSKWRKLPGTLDPADLPSTWTCSLNTDVNQSNCSVLEDVWENANPDHYVLNTFTLGSVVWVQDKGAYSPAMVDDDPDTDTFFWLPLHSNEPNYYHVTYFGSPASRRWERTRSLLPFHSDKDLIKFKLKEASSNRRLREAVQQATLAKALPLKERRKKYCFAARYRGPWFSDKKTTGEKRKRNQKGNKGPTTLKKKCIYVL